MVSNLLLNQSANFFFIPMAISFIFRSSIFLLNLPLLFHTILLRYPGLSPFFYLIFICTDFVISFRVFSYLRFGVLIFLFVASAYFPHGDLFSRVICDPLS